MTNLNLNLVLISSIEKLKSKSLQMNADGIIVHIALTTWVFGLFWNWAKDGFKLA
jgi:hypothetical protein